MVKIYRVESFKENDHAVSELQYVFLGPYCSETVISSWARKSTKNHTDKNHPHLRKDDFLYWLAQEVNKFNLNQ